MFGKNPSMHTTDITKTTSWMDAWTTCVMSNGGGGIKNASYTVNCKTIITTQIKYTYDELFQYTTQS